MTTSYVLFGIECGSLEEARLLVERTLHVTLQGHESDYQGGDYYRLRDPKTENLKLKRNYYESRNEWAEADHKEAPFLLCVSDTRRGEEIIDVLTSVEGVRCLRHRKI